MNFIWNSLNLFFYIQLFACVTTTKSLVDFHIFEIKCRLKTTELA